ncbi:magnesium transporter [Bacillus timonensis]|nr:magnesium transporter [Bacillus timonensis]
MAKQLTNSELTLLVIQSLKDTKKTDLQDLLLELQPYDFARLYEDLPEKHHSRFLLYLTTEQIAEMLQELDKDEQLTILTKIGIEKAAVVMDMMDNDDLAFFFDQLSTEQTREFLSTMKQEESEAVQDLMKYPPETAGRIMTNRYVWIPHHYTVRNTVDKLKTFAEIAETINYLYVINEERKLVGVVSYRDLLLADINAAIRDIMFERVISVSSFTDQEEVAGVIERYDFLAVPVVNDEEKLVGIVTVDDIIDVVIQEANEDIEKLSATGKSIDFETRAWVAAYRRLPWLILLLFIGIVSGSIISRFEDTLQKVVALAFFMPMIAGMTGNTGTQSLAVVVRGLVSRDMSKPVIVRLVLRELGVGLIIGTICGILIAVIAYLWKGEPVLGLVVGTSLFITLIIGTLAGTVIPLFLFKLKIDPAIASGPLITTLNDIFSLLIYFGLATAFITYLM